MSRRRRRRGPSFFSQIRFEMKPETKRGILVVFCFAVSAMLFLSYLDLAGMAGSAIDTFMAELFGWDRILLPFVCILIGASLTFERVRLSGFNYIGILFFFLSFNAIVNLAAFKEGDLLTREALANAGGYAGLFLHEVLTSLVGFWGALVILFALLLISLLLLFNTSLRSLFTIHTHVTGPLGALFHERLARRRTDETVTVKDEEVDEEEEEETEEEEEVAPVSMPVAKGKAEPAEQVLSSRRQRKIEIPLDLLEYRGSKANSGDIGRNSEIIQKTFEQFGIDVEMAETSVGPTVTQYALRPSEGVKLARIVALQNDLALALAAHPIRIEAPIPGKSLVGIEVPNQSVATVSLRELLESKVFRKRDNDMMFALGKDVSGAPWMVRIDKMPHLLVAGATGSGKSVCLNTLILSLLYQNGPDDLKLIMVDPKRVELTTYEGIPHLLVPPITKTDDTINALKWAVREMERRLDVLSKFGVRDLASYNAKSDAKIPKLVIIIDELADVMATARGDVEALIVRIAQMARAVGIHLVLATQRPSVDVITGLIKANIPARIAFAVASQIDSRTILDASGAEKLVGRGDMLYSSAELSKPKRLQGPFVSDQEIDRVVKFLRQSSEPDYNYTITEKQKSGTIFDSSDTEEPMLEEAIMVVMEAGKASTSLLQRRLKLGYSRAARIIDLMEQHGIVGPQEGAKPRELMIKEWPPAGSSSEPVDQEDEEGEDEAAEEETEEEPEETEAGEEEDAQDGEWFEDAKKD